MHSIKIQYFVLICIASFIFFVWIELSMDKEVSYEFKIDLKKFLNIYDPKNVIDLRSKHSQKKINNQKKKNVKYVLVWPSNKFPPFSSMAHGQKDFFRLKCPVTNCFVTSNRQYFNDIRDFDVIAFMGNELYKFQDELPEYRAKDQNYIYFNMDSSAKYPVDNEVFDDYFNGTATYRLDSEIPLPYILIRDADGNVVGPKTGINWVSQEDVDFKMISDVIKFEDRKLAAATFMMDCESLSPREEALVDLQIALKQSGYEIDVYGTCGSFDCSRNFSKCYEKWRNNYYFYLSYENSLDDDYVTSNILIALQNGLVPIVYGGANYTRFLPPGSYLNALRMRPKKLAEVMVELMTSPKDYIQYFWWKKYYTYHDPNRHENICNICSAITNQKLWTTKDKYKKFRDWWNINYTKFIV